MMKLRPQCLLISLVLAAILAIGGCCKCKEDGPAAVDMEPVPPAPFRPTTLTTVSPHPDAPLPANLNDPPPPVPMESSDAHVEEQRR